MRKWIIGSLLLLIVLGVYWRTRPKKSPLAESYIGDANVILWSSTAAVRQEVAQLHWGEAVEVFGHNGAQVEIRTAQGATGWIDSRSLLDADAWQSEKHLLDSVQRMPLQAAGHTKVFSNVHLTPRRDAQRIYQLPGGVPVAVVARAYAEIPPSGSGSAAGESPKKEDWLLVYGPAPGAAKDAGGVVSSEVMLTPAAVNADLATGTTPAQRQASTGERTPPIAGWVVARFVSYDLPETIRDYASSAGIRPVAWFVLNRVPDAGVQRPQFLLAGSKSGENPECDFSMLRVYTWDAKKQRYETAYVEGNLCGMLPVRIDQQSGTADAEFRFKERRDGATSEALYRMRQTTVRRVREGAPLKKPASRKRH